MSKSIVPCLVFVERAMKGDQSAHHRIAFDTIFEHDTMGSVLKELGIGSKCRLVGALQVFAARVVTMCAPSYRRFQTRSSVLCGSCSRTCRRAGVNDMYDAAQCIHLFFFCNAMLPPNSKVLCTRIFHCSLACHAQCLLIVTWRRRFACTLRSVMVARMVFLQFWWPARRHVDRL